MMKITRDDALRRLDRIIERTHREIQSEMDKPLEQRQREMEPRLETLRERYEGWPEGSSPDDIEIA